MVTKERILEIESDRRDEMESERVTVRHGVALRAMSIYGHHQAIAFYEWARIYNMSHMTEHLQAGKLPTVEELWEKYEQQNKQS